MRLKILTWNIAYGHGPGSEGAPDWRRQDRSHYENALSAVASLIRNTGTDIVLLQEVDFDASRSHGIQQLDTLARRSGLLHRSACVSWDLPYLPYPGLNPLHQFGRIRSGGGILSRFPIRALGTDLLPKPKDKSFLYRSLSLHRYFQIVETGGLRLLNLHLEAFSEENRELHLHRLNERILELKPDVCGGDFNGPIGLRESLVGEFVATPAPEPTFPAPAPVSVLDGFILKKDRVQSHRLQVPDTGTFSDHFPVLLELELRP